MTFHLKHSKKFILSVFCMCLSLLVLPDCLWADQILQPLPPTVSNVGYIPVNAAFLNFNKYEEISNVWPKFPVMNPMSPQQQGRATWIGLFSNTGGPGSP